MKAHITKSYAELDEKNIRCQAAAVSAAEKLGVREMGIPDCTAGAGYSYVEISKMLDGVIAPLETGDAVVILLPTGNGIEFEQRLLERIAAYAGTKPYALWSDREYFANYEEDLRSYIEEETLVTDECEELRLQGILIDFVMDRMKGCQENTLCLTGENDIHIGFGLHDKSGSYYRWTLATIESVMENTDTDVFFHIMCDDTVSEECKEKFRKTVKNGGQKLEFKVISQDEFKSIEGISGRYSIATFFRLKIPEMFPELDRFIYLDSDLFVNMDIAELWNIDIKDYCLAAVKDPGSAGVVYPVRTGQVSDEEYFNAGVLYMNLDKIREKGDMFRDTLKYCMDNPEANLPDQDALNVIYRGQILLIDEKFNYYVSKYRSGNHRLENNIYHFAATISILYDSFDLEYRYNEMLSRLSDDIDGYKLNQKRSAEKLEDRKNYLLSFVRSIQRQNKELVFYGGLSPAMRSMIRKLYGQSENFLRFETLTEDIAAKISDKIVLVLAEAEDGLGMKKLEALGFVNGETYFVIPRLLDYKEGGYAF